MSSVKSMSPFLSFHAAQTAANSRRSSGIAPPMVARCDW